MCCASLLETVTEKSADALLLGQIRQNQIGLEGCWKRKSGADAHEA